MNDEIAQIARALCRVNTQAGTAFGEMFNESRGALDAAKINTIFSESGLTLEILEYLDNRSIQINKEEMVRRHAIMAQILELLDTMGIVWKNIGHYGSEPKYEWIVPSYTFKSVEEDWVDMVKAAFIQLCTLIATHPLINTTQFIKCQEIRTFRDSPLYVAYAHMRDVMTRHRRLSLEDHVPIIEAYLKAHAALAVPAPHSILAAHRSSN